MENRIELHAKTRYSMDHESTVDIKDLILKCSSFGEKGVAIVDSGSILSFYKAEKILKELSLKDFKLIYGVEVNVDLNNSKYKAVILLKRRKGLPVLYRLLSFYFTTNELSLEELIQNKEDFLIGLIYDENNFIHEILPFFNYVEVDNKVSKEVIAKLKKDTLVVYSNRINALSKDEELSKKIIYNKLHIKGNVDTRLYKTTQDTLKEIDDKEIVIENSNKIFNMIDKFDLLEDRSYLPVNKDFSINSLVNTKLHEKYGNNIPLKIKERVDLELKLIKKLNYEGYIDLYKKIIDKCKEEKEEYVIYDYINNLYIAYLLEITHFEPVNSNLDTFFSNHPSITIKVSENFIKKLNMFIKKELNINTIGCKGIMTLSNTKIQNIISNYEKSHNLKVSNEEYLAINKYLMYYPLNNNRVTSKDLIIPEGVNIFDFSPRELIEIMNEKTSYQKFTNIDYKDIEDKFITLQLISDSKITCLTELKYITGDRTINCVDKNNLNEKSRIEYELLYYKEHYQLDYYYIILKNCSFNDEIVNIIKNGFEEVKRNINKFPVYKSEYKYLKLAIELYEKNLIDIGYKVIKEKYSIKLDKDKKKIVLLINKLNNDIDNYISSKLSLIGTRPLYGKMEYISKILFKLLKDNKAITLFGFDGPINFYIAHLLNEITGIDNKAIWQYLNPCSCYKNSLLKMNEEDYIHGIRYLLSHDLTIKNYFDVKNSIIKGTNTMLDKLVYMIKNSEIDIAIIDRVESIEGNLGETLKKLKEITDKTNVTIILFTNLKKEYEKNHKKEIYSFENNILLDKYINCINILDREELFLIKKNYN